MKKEKIITATIGLCLAASLLAGCNETTGESAAASQLGGGQTQISVENSQGAAVSTEGQYCFNFNGYTIMPGMEVQPIIAALGDNYEFLEDFSLLPYSVSPPIKMCELQASELPARARGRHKREAF